MDEMVETKVYREPADANRRIIELDLTRNGLLKVRAVALSSSANVTDFHAVNAAGTFAYQYGTWALRNEFAGEVWQLDRTDGVEAIRNENKRVKVIFTNVDLACNDIIPPKPRSRKGAGAERACQGNLFDVATPLFAPRQTDNWATYYFMLDVNGAAELTRPVIKGNTFTSYIERIYLADGSAPYDDETIFGEQDNAVVDFEPMVARK